MAFERIKDVHEHVVSANIGPFSPLQNDNFAIIWWDIGKGPEVLLAHGTFAAIIYHRDSSS